jgi:hypothetical protein
MLEIQLHPNTLYTAQIIEDFAKERALVLSMKGSLKSKALMYIITLSEKRSEAF